MQAFAHPLREFESVKISRHFELDENVVGVEAFLL